MRGVIIKKSNLVHEDERRKIIEIMNGELNIKNIKILHVKKGEHILGNHWHTYPEIMYVMKGKAHYWLKHVFTQETQEVDLEEGDIMIKTGFIAHTCKINEEAILIDGAVETWIGEDYNHIREVLQ